MKTVGTLLFPGFELLDVFGPLEMFGALPEDFTLQTVAETAGPIESRQGPKAIADVSLADAKPYDILLVPGGRGTRREVDNAALINWLKRHAEASGLVATVCTGAALLARTGLLDGRKATSNKASFAWVVSQGAKRRLAAACPLGRRREVLHLLGRLGRHGHGARPHCQRART